MTREEIIGKLKAGKLIIIFTKTNGEERVMSCSLSPEFLPAIEMFVENTNPIKVNLNQIRVWDLDKEAWRSFRLDSIKEVKDA